MWGCAGECDRYRRSGRAGNPEQASGRWGVGIEERRNGGGVGETCRSGFGGVGRNGIQVDKNIFDICMLRKLHYIVVLGTFPLQ